MKNLNEKDFEKRMKLLESYFEKHSMPLNLKEAQSINKILFKKEISKNDIETMVKIFNQNNSSSLHFNGSGWFDFRIHLSSFFKKHNIKFKIQENGNLKVLI